jgi:hypothetical protein
VTAQCRRHERCEARGEYAGSKSSRMKDHFRSSFARYVSKKMEFFARLSSMMQDDFEPPRVCHALVQIGAISIGLNGTRLAVGLYSPDFIDRLGGVADVPFFSGRDFASTVASAIKNALREPGTQGIQPSWDSEPTR